MHRYMRYMCMVIALLAGIGFFVALMTDRPRSVHGGFDIVMFGYDRNELVGIMLLIVAGIASVGALVLFFSTQARVQRAIVLLLGVSIIFAGIVFAYLFLFRMSR